MVRALCVLTFSCNVCAPYVYRVRLNQDIYFSLIISRCSICMSVSFRFLFFVFFFAACLPFAQDYFFNGPDDMWNDWVLVCYGFLSSCFIYIDTSRLRILFLISISLSHTLSTFLTQRVQCTSVCIQNNKYFSHFFPLLLFYVRSFTRLTLIVVQMCL